MHPACRGTSCLLAWPGDQCHPETVHLNTPLLAHTEQGCFPGPPGMAGPTSQRPSYLPVGLTGDFIGVAQNLQLHVRLEDPAAERRGEKQSSKSVTSSGSWQTPPGRPCTTPSTA